MGCLVCIPACDRCQPKYFTCPSCGGLAFFKIEACPACSYEHTKHDRERGMEEWRAKRDAARQ